MLFFSFFCILFLVFCLHYTILGLPSYQRHITVLYSDRPQHPHDSVKDSEWIWLTGDRETRGGLAVSCHKGHLSGVVCLTVPDGQGVLSQRGSDGNAGILLQLLAVPSPVRVRARMFQLHAEDDRVADRNYCPSRKLFSDVTWEEEEYWLQMHYSL